MIIGEWQSLWIIQLGAAEAQEWVMSVTNKTFSTLVCMYLQLCLHPCRGQWMQMSIWPLFIASHLLIAWDKKRMGHRKKSCNIFFYHLYILGFFICTYWGNCLFRIDYLFPFVKVIYFVFTFWLKPCPLFVSKSRYSNRICRKLPLNQFWWVRRYSVSRDTEPWQARTVGVRQRITISLYSDKINSMTTLLLHTFAHFTGPSYMLKTKQNKSWVQLSKSREKMDIILENRVL